MSKYSIEQINKLWTDNDIKIKILDENKSNKVGCQVYINYEKYKMSKTIGEFKKNGGDKEAFKKLFYVNRTKKSYIEILDDIDILSDILDSGSDKSISMGMSDKDESEEDDNNQPLSDIKSDDKLENCILNNDEIVDKNIRIIHADCLKELDKIDDNTIDCFITDPPYFIDKLDNNWDSNKMNDHNSHIKSLPKGMSFNKGQSSDLYDYYFQLSNIIIKKLKPGGYFLSFSSPRLYHSIAMACDKSGFEIRDMINWIYTVSMPKGMSITHIIKKKDIPEELKQNLIKKYENLKTPQIRSCFEPICVAMKPRNGTFLENELKFNTGMVDFSNKVGSSSDKVPCNVITTDEIDDVYDSNFLIQKPNKKEKGEYNTHITVKPVKLMEHLIKLFSKKNSLIVDPFIGSGSTAVACQNTGRRCIGYELNKEYYDICLKRLQ